MMLSVLHQFVLATDCFKLNTQVTYSTQRYNVVFQATPSLDLIGEEKRLCETVIHEQQYEIQIQLGDIKFSKTGLTYDKEGNMTITVECQGNISNCAYSKVQKVQTATYSLIFYEIDLTLTSIVNYYQIHKYNHLSCIRTANLRYDGVQKSMEVEVMDPVLNCPCNLFTPTTIQPPLKYKNNVFIVSKVDGVALLTHAYNEKNYTNVLSFNTTGNPGPLAHKPSQPEKFWTELVKIGPYNQRNFITIGVLLAKIRNAPVLKLAMKIELLTEIKQVRGAQNMPTKSLYYNQSIEYSIAQLTNQNQADCFTGVAVELHKTFFYANTALNPYPTKCSRAYIEEKSGGPYDEIRMQIIASQNLDKSGFNYHTEHTLIGYEIGADIMERFYCKDEEDCNQLLKIAKMQRDSENVSVSVKLLFIRNDSITFAISYLSNFVLSGFNATNVSILGELVCLEIHPLTTGSQAVEFRLFDHEFDLTQYMSAHQTSYCSELTTKQQSEVTQIINKMKKGVSIKAAASLTVGSQIVGDLTVNVYQIPRQRLLVWILCGAFCALSVCGSIGLSLGFRKDNNIWETGHILVATTQ